MAPEEPNEITLRVIPNTWSKQAYLQGWYFEGRTYKDTYKIYERIKIAAQVYEGGNTFKNTNRAEANRASNGRKCKGGENRLTNQNQEGMR